MNDKILAWVFGIAAITNLFNIYFSYKNGNWDATVAWMTSTCFSLSALGAYLKIIDKNKEDEEI